MLFSSHSDLIFVIKFKYTATQKPFPEWLVDTMNGLSPRNPLHRIGNPGPAAVFISQTDSSPTEITLLSGPMQSEDSFTVFPGSSPSPADLIFKTKPLRSSVELQHPAPIKRANTSCLLTERSLYQEEPTVAGFQHQIPLNQETNVNDYRALSDRDAGTRSGWIPRGGSDLEGPSTLGDPANPSRIHSRTATHSSQFQASRTARIDPSLHHSPLLRRRNHHYSSGPQLPPGVKEPHLIQPVPPLSDPRHVHPAGFAQSELRRHLPHNTWDPVSEALLRTDRSFISPLLGMAAMDHDLQTAMDVQVLSRVAPPSGDDTNHLSTLGGHYLPLNSPTTSSEHIRSNALEIADTFNKKLMKHALTSYPRPLPALNFVDALLRRRRDNKYISRDRLYPQLDAPEMIGNPGRKESALPATQTPGLDNLVISNGGCSPGPRAADLHAREAFTPNWSSCGRREMSGGREASNAIQYHEGVTLDQYLDSEAGYENRPSPIGAAHSALRAPRHLSGHGNYPDSPSTFNDRSSRSICAAVRGAVASWRNQNNKPSAHASLGDLGRHPDIKNTAASCPRTPPSKLSPLDNPYTTSYVKNVASYPRTPSAQPVKQVGRNSEHALSPTQEQSGPIHSSDAPDMVGHATLGASRSINQGEPVRPADPISPPDSPKVHEMTGSPENLTFSEMMDEDNEDWINRNEVTTGAHVDFAGSHHWHDEGDGGSSMLLVKSDDALEWSENGDIRRSGSHDSIESWSNTDVLSFLKGELRSK